MNWTSKISDFASESITGTSSEAKEERKVLLLLNFSLSLTHLFFSSIFQTDLKSGPNRCWYTDTSTHCLTFCVSVSFKQLCHKRRAPLPLMSGMRKREREREREEKFTLLYIYFSSNEDGGVFHFEENSFKIIKKLTISNVTTKKKRDTYYWHQQGI